MPDQTQEELARYWDALATGADPGPVSLDPSLAQVVQRFTGATDVPGPDSTFLANLMVDLMYAHALPDARPRRPSWTTAGPRLREQLSTPALPIPGTWSRWLPVLFSAALLVITLGIAISQLSWGPDDDQRGPAGPAIHAPATPSPDDTLADETLVEIILPADLLPADEPVNATMSTVTVPVGTFQQGPDEAIDNPGFLATYILHGTVSVVSDEPMQWIRGGGAGTTEEVEAGTEVTLRPGDAVVTRKSPGEVWTNEGPDDVRMFAMEAFGGARMTSAFPFGWVMTDTGWDAESLEGWPDDQPTILRLRRVTAPNGTVLPLPAEAIVQLARSDDGSSIGKQSDGSIRFIGGSGMGTAFVMTIEPVEEAATPAP